MFGSLAPAVPSAGVTAMRCRSSAGAQGAAATSGG
jgi:hypothetical protein